MNFRSLIITITMFVLTNYAFSQQTPLTDGSFTNNGITYIVSSSDRIIHVSSSTLYSTIQDLEKSTSGHQILNNRHITINKQNLMEAKTAIIGNKRLNVTFYIKDDSTLLDISYIIYKHQNITVNELKAIDNSFRRDFKCQITWPNETIKGYNPYVTSVYLM